MKRRMLVPVEFVFEIEGDIEEACDTIRDQIVNDGNAYYVDDDSKAQMESVTIQRFDILGEVK